MTSSPYDNNDKSSYSKPTDSIKNGIKKESNTKTIPSSGTLPKIDPLILSFIGHCSLHVLVDKFLDLSLKQINHSNVHNDNQFISFISSLSPKTRLYLVEKIPSTLNAILVSGLSIKSLFFDKSFSGDDGTTAATAKSTHDEIYHNKELKPAKSSDFYNEYPKLMDTAFALHQGFTIYDLLIMSIRGKEHISVWLHHVFGLAGVSFIRLFRQATFFPACFCPSECTVVVSNLIWIMQNFGHLKSKFPKFYFGLLVLRMFVFLIFRAFTGPLCILYALKRMDNESTNSCLSPSSLSSSTVIREKTQQQMQNQNEGTKSDHCKPRDTTHAKFILSYKIWFTRFIKLYRQYLDLPMMVKTLGLCNVILFSALNAYWSALTVRAVFNEFIKLQITNPQSQVQLKNLSHLLPGVKNGIHHI